MRCCYCKKKKNPDESAEETEVEDGGMSCKLGREPFDPDSPGTTYSQPENTQINCNYVRNLENEFECLQKAFLSLTTHFARLQFRLRQIMQAAPEERFGLLCDLERIAFEGVDEKNCLDELPRIQRDIRCMGDIRRKVNGVIEKLRCQLATLSEASELEPVDGDDEGHSSRKSSMKIKQSENESPSMKSGKQQSEVELKSTNLMTKASSHRSVKQK